MSWLINESISVQADGKGDPKIWKSTRIKKFPSNLEDFDCSSAEFKEIEPSHQLSLLKLQNVRFGKIQWKKK